MKHVSPTNAEIAAADVYKRQALPTELHLQNNGSRRII